MSLFQWNANHGHVIITQTQDWITPYGINMVIICATSFGGAGAGGSTSDGGGGGGGSGGIIFCSKVQPGTIVRVVIDSTQTNIYVNGILTATVDAGVNASAQSGGDPGGASFQSGGNYIFGNTVDGLVGQSASSSTGGNGGNAAGGIEIGGVGGAGGASGSGGQEGFPYGGGGGGAGANSSDGGIPGPAGVKIQY